MDFINIYKKMYLIRSFERLLLKLFEQGKLFGTTHTYVGQEAIAVSVMEDLEETDIYTLYTLFFRIHRNS